MMSVIVSVFVNLVSRTIGDYRPRTLLLFERFRSKFVTSRTLLPMPLTWLCIEFGLTCLVTWLC